MPDTPDRCPNCNGSEAGGVRLGEIRYCNICGLRVGYWPPAIAALQSRVKEVEGERDRQYEENVARIAAQGKAELRTEELEFVLSQVAVDIEYGQLSASTSDLVKNALTPTGANDGWILDTDSSVVTLGDTDD